MTSLDEALSQFEATEANLGKLEALWAQLRSLLPDGLEFGSPPEYEELSLAFRKILPSLPAIDGFRVEDRLLDYDQVGQMRFDALEVDELSAHVAVANEIDEQGRNLREYRFRLNAKRRELVRSRMLTLIDTVTALLSTLERFAEGQDAKTAMPESAWSQLTQTISEIDALLGSSARPSRWSDLRRHLHFGKVADFIDIVKLDWPDVKPSLRTGLYGQHDALPVEAKDLAEIVAARPQGPVTTRLNWSVLSDEDFERLMFTLISETEGYENPQWLQQTHAPDRGRDLSVTRVDRDPLSGVRRHRIIIQCKHWLARSVAPADVGTAKTQMELWQPPRVDGLVIATTGRFTADAIALVEQHNQSDRALHISMWPDTHLELLLAQRPHLIAQFKLRGSS